MTLKYDKFKCYWAAVTEKKTSNSVYREGPSLSAKILHQKWAFSPATVVSEKQDYYQSTANKVFSLP